MARHVGRYCSTVKWRLLAPMCSSSVPVNSSAMSVRPQGMFVGKTQWNKMIRGRWRRHAWTDDPVVKDAFNKIVKGSSSFSKAEAHNALEHFNVLTKKTTLPDYMAVKMASIATVHFCWEDGKKILDRHYMSTGAESRFAGEASLLDEQVEGALHRIFDNIEEGAYEIARQFYCCLVDLRFSKVKNGVLKIFMQHLLEKGNVKRAVEELDYFVSYGKHGSLSGAVFLVLRAAFKESDVLMKKATRVMERSVKNRLQQICIMGCVFLAEGLHLRFANFLRDQNYEISLEDVEFICGVARSCKEPVILESFVVVHEIFSLTDESRAKLYESLIRIYGKASDLNGLLKVWERVVAEKNLNNFRVVVLKLGHFYRCNDFLLPSDLQYYLQQYRE